VGPHPIALAADVDNRDVVQEAVEGRAGRLHDPFIASGSDCPVTGGAECRRL